MQERLQKILSGAGVCSRRAAETLMEQGRVSVNGIPAKLGDSADPDTDIVCVDGREIGGHAPLLTVMLHKPVNVVTTMSDEKGRKTVAQLVQRCPVRVLPVGRLDQFSEGLLLMTSDGALLDALTHPRHHVDKLYEVTVRGDQNGVLRLSQPMEIDGYPIRPARVVRKGRGAMDSMVLHLTIHEGRNRQIRKMCAKCGLKVLRLRRLAVGPIRLDDTLKPGHWRELRREELEALYRAAGLTPPEME